MPAAHWCWEVCIQLCRSRARSALALLVARIGADHHDPPMPTDHPALVTDWLDARVHLHGCSILFCFVRSCRRSDAVTCTGTRCGRGTGRRETTPPPPGP